MNTGLLSLMSIISMASTAVLDSGTLPASVAMTVIL